jgi:demethylmenaquinone methyltransferase / 2-methoxy-6-polyprenyl-1,4-benzoquinol methylase
MAIGNSTNFGASKVKHADKQHLVDNVFSAVAHRYDLMNDLMSLGVHRAWKNRLVAKLNPSPIRPCSVLDVAGGTGDIAFRIIDAGGPRTKVTVCDINADMLSIGRERARRRYPKGNQLEFAKANAEALPFPDATFDAYTIAFGIRNVPSIEAALSEAFRVLRLGGRFLCLEFSSVDTPGLDMLYDAYSSAIIPALGGWVAGNADAYRYLVESIKRFPRPAVFARMIAQAGFRRVSHQPLSGNIAAIHSAWKL